MRRFVLVPLAALAVSLAGCQTVNINSESPGSKAQDIWSSPSSEVMLRAIDAASDAAAAVSGAELAGKAADVAKPGADGVAK